MGSGRVTTHPNEYKLLLNKWDGMLKNAKRPLQQQLRLGYKLNQWLSLYVKRYKGESLD